MKVDATDEERIRQYLLGLIAPGEGSQLEERLLTDAVLYEELLIVEDELIDQHLAGRLSAAEQKSFESHFLNAPERQRKLRFARSLQKYVTHASQKTPELQAKKPVFSLWPFSKPVLAYSAAAAAVLLVIGISWTLLHRAGSTATHPGSLLTVVLTPGGTRDGGEVKRFALSPDVGSVQFLLQLPGESYTFYSVRLETAEGQVIETREKLVPEVVDGKKVISIKLPAQALYRADFQIKLVGVTAQGQEEPIGNYPFRVTGP